MGSHLHQVAIQVTDDKLDCFVIAREKLAWTKRSSFFLRDQYCHLGLMAPHYLIVNYC